MRRAGCLVGLAILLASCGSSENPDVQALWSRLNGQSEEVVPRYVALLKASAPALQVGFPDQKKGKGGGTLLRESENNGLEHWLTPEGAHVILQDGMLHGLRGFGTGLMTSDLSQPLFHLRGLTPGVSDRFHTFLTGNDETVTRTYRCVFERAGAEQIDLPGARVDTILMIERCRSLDQSFENFYWVMPLQGRIVLSRQWAGPELGALSTRVVP